MKLGMSKEKAIKHYSKREDELFIVRFNMVVDGECGYTYSDDMFWSLFNDEQKVIDQVDAYISAMRDSAIKEPICSVSGKHIYLPKIENSVPELVTMTFEDALSCKMTTAFIKTQRIK